MDLTGIKQVYLIDFTVTDIFYNTFHLILHRGEQIFKKRHLTGLFTQKFIVEGWLLKDCISSNEYIGNYVKFIN